MPKAPKKIALVGNPNSGKTSLFNRLTGLNQKVGNFAGVTTARYSGRFVYNEQAYELVDLPGSYSLYARTEDEQVLLRSLFSEEHFVGLLVVVDATNLKRSLLLLTQSKDLGFPLVVALNMVDEAFQAGLKIDVAQLSARLGVPIVATNARKGEGLVALQRALEGLQARQGTLEPFLAESYLPQRKLLTAVREQLCLPNDYWAHMYLQQGTSLHLPAQTLSVLKKQAEEASYKPLPAQREELTQRQNRIATELHALLPLPSQGRYRYSDVLDKFLTHGFYGTLVFLTLLLLVFQAVFSWSVPLMEHIDAGFSFLRTEAIHLLPTSALTDLFTTGILAGIAGVMIFIPQIGFLFLMIGFLEESGYMARVVALSDKQMRRFGLSGRSIIPLVAGMACAIPAIMATRNIGQYKARLLTILVLPLISCSARLPVYTMLIALIFVDTGYWGPFNLQGLLLLGMYVLGLVAALSMSTLLQWVLPTRTRNFLLVELPPYRWPLLRNVLLTTYEKVRSFIFDAGKIILALSIVLHVLSSYGGTATYERALHRLQAVQGTPSANEQRALRLQHSYMGQIGRAIEPLIRPLGYDWKIGIALIGSFAAREVFVSTLAIVYGMNDDDPQQTSLRARLQSERNSHTGKPVFTAAVCLSLLVFYAFAMQCMSTLVVTYKETRQWRWPLLQFVYMTGLAYVAAWGCYTLFA